MTFARTFTIVLATVGAACSNSATSLPDARSIPDASPVVVPDAAPIDGHPIVDAGVADAIAADAGLAFELVAAPPANGAIGYTDSNNASTAVLFDNHGRATQCRSGHVPEVDALSFADCPTPDEMGVVSYAVQATTGKTDGGYRVDVQYIDQNQTQQLFSLPLYMHRSMNGALPCNSDSTWPTDDAFFTAAVQTFSLPSIDPNNPSWITANGIGTLPHSVPFTDLDVTAPTYQFGFTGVSGVHVASAGGALNISSLDSSGAISTASYAAGANANFDLQLLSLRHRFALNADKTLLLISRNYESSNARYWRNQHLCPMRTTWFFDNNAFNCDAYVMNSAGEGFCMQSDGSGHALQSVFSRLLVAKLIHGQFATAPELGLPSDSPQTMWGRNYYDALDAEPDNDFVDTSNLWPPNAGPDQMTSPVPVVILRP